MPTCCNRECETPFCPWCGTDLNQPVNITSPSKERDWTLDDLMAYLERQHRGAEMFAARSDEFGDEIGLKVWKHDAVVWEHWASELRQLIAEKAPTPVENTQ